MRNSSRNLIPIGASAVVVAALASAVFVSISSTADDIGSIPTAGAVVGVKALRQDTSIRVGHGPVTGFSQLSRLDSSGEARPLRLGRGTGSLSSATDGARRQPIVSIPRAIAADCSSDVTLPLLKWLATVANGSVVRFGHGCYRIEGTLQLSGRINLTLEGGTFRSYDPPEDQRAIWRVIDSAGFKFRNMTIVGSFHQSDIDPRHDASLQHAHAIDLRGTSAEISHIHAFRLAGDCVYFGLGLVHRRRNSGAVRDSVCRGTSTRRGVRDRAVADITISETSPPGSACSVRHRSDVGPGRHRCEFLFLRQSNRLVQSLRLRADRERSDQRPVLPPQRCHWLTMTANVANGPSTARRCRANVELGVVREATREQRAILKSRA